MKHSIYYLAIVAAMLVSCKVQEIEQPNASLDIITFSAVNAEAHPTRTVLQSDGSVWWNPADSINIFNADGVSARFISVNSDPAAETDFTGHLEGYDGTGSSEFWAVYPYSSGNSFDGAAITLTLPYSQKAVAGTFDGGLVPTIARTTDYNLNFYNVCGGVKFFVDGEGISQVRFKGNNSEILAGTVKVAFDSDGKPQVTEVVDGKTEIRLDAPGGGTFTPGEWYYIVALPTALNYGYTISFYDGNSLISENSSDTSVSVKRAIWGKLSNADVLPDPPHIVFTSDTVSIKWSIDNWDASTYPHDATYETLSVDGDMVAIAARAVYGDKLSNETFDCVLTPSDFENLKTLAAANQTTAIEVLVSYADLYNAYPPNATGHEFRWVNRTSLDVRLSKVNGQAWAWPTKDSTVVFVNGYLVENKYCIVGVPVTFSPAPAKNQPAVTLTGELAYRGEEANFRNMLDDVIAPDVIEALDAVALKDVYADFLANLTNTSSVFKTGYTAGKSIAATQHAGQTVKLFNNSNYPDSSLFVLSVQNPNTNALYGMTYQDSVCYNAWGLNFPVKLQATVEDAPKYAFELREDYRLTITDYKAKKGEAYARLFIDGNNQYVPENINLKQLIHITRPAGAPSIVTAQYPNVWIKVKEIVDTAYVAGDNLAMYNGITFNGTALNTTASTEMSYSKNARLYSTIGGDLVNEFLLSNNCYINWGSSIVNRFTLKLSLMVDSVEVDECTITFKTTNPIVSIEGKTIEVEPADVTSSGVTLQPTDVHALLDGLQASVLYQPETAPLNTVNVFAENGYVNFNYTQTTAVTHYYTYGSDSPSAFTGSYNSSYWDYIKTSAEGYGEAYPANSVKYYFGSPSAGSEWYNLTTLINNCTGITAKVADKTAWTWSDGNVVVDRPISQNEDMFAAGLEYHAVYADYQYYWSYTNYGAYQYTHTLIPLYNVETDAYLTLSEGISMVDAITVNIPVVVQSRYTGYVDVEAAAPKFEANNVESAIKVTFKK